MMQGTVGVLPIVIHPLDRSTASLGLVPNSGSNSGGGPIRLRGRAIPPTRGPGREPGRNAMGFGIRTLVILAYGLAFGLKQLAA